MNDAQTGHFERQARDLYLRAGPRVDPATAARLRAARVAALADRRRHARWMVPAGACAVAVLAVAVLWQPLRGPATVATVGPAAAADRHAELTQPLPPDADRTDPALYQNLGFYTWLAQQPPAGHAGTKR